MREKCVKGRSRKWWRSGGEVAGAGVGVEKMDGENEGRIEGSLNNKTIIEEIFRLRKKKKKMIYN